MKYRKELKKKYIDFVVDRIKKNPKLMTIGKQVRKNRVKPLKAVKA